MKLLLSQFLQSLLKRAPSVVEAILVSLFAFLWVCWVQPHTIGMRHVLLTLGSLLGLCVISQNIHLFKSRSALPIYLVTLLFIWITFHLFFLSHQYELQLTEYRTVWKRIVWGAPFAIGLGIALGAHSNPQLSFQSKVSKHVAEYSTLWWIFLAGIVAPTAIYLARSLLMLLGAEFGWQLPNFAIHWPSSSTWHITKMSIVFFCLPALAIACGQIIHIFRWKAQNKFLILALYIAIILSVLTVFNLENTKNGMVYSVILILVMLVKIGVDRRGVWHRRGVLIATLVVIAMFFLVAHHVRQNDSWRTLFADIKVASQLEQIDSWKYYGTKGYPINEMGKQVSVTNYERAAWAQVAVGFIKELPLGYGLIYKSFGYYGKEKWPGSILFQAHSAWLDLTLGIGIPGVFLLLLAGGLALRNALQSCSDLWGGVALWAIMSIVLLMTTTEVSQPIYLDALIFMVLWSAGLGLNNFHASQKGSRVTRN